MPTSRELFEEEERERLAPRLDIPPHEESEQVQRMLRYIDIEHDAIRAGVNSLTDDEYNPIPSEELLERLTNSFTEGEEGEWVMAFGVWDHFRLMTSEMTDEFRHGLLLGIMATKQAIVYLHEHATDRPPFRSKD